MFAQRTMDGYRNFAGDSVANYRETANLTATNYRNIAGALGNLGGNQSDSGAEWPAGG